MRSWIEDEDKYLLGDEVICLSVNIFVISSINIGFSYIIILLEFGRIFFCFVLDCWIGNY